MVSAHVPAHLLEYSTRVHDQAFYDWLGRLRVDYGHFKTPNGKILDLTHFPILRTQAAPDVAFAEMRDILVRRGWIKGDSPTDAYDEARKMLAVPLPFLSITREDPESAPDQANVPGVWRGLGYNNENRTTFNHAYPGTYLLNYQVNIWCSKSFTETFIREWMMSQLGLLGAAHHETFIHVCHAEPWGIQRHGLRVTSFSDMSELEIDNDKRYRRFNAQFEMNMFVFRKPEEVPVYQPITDPTTPGPYIPMAKTKTTFSFPIYDRQMFKGSKGVYGTKLGYNHFAFDFVGNSDSDDLPFVTTGLRGVKDQYNSPEFLVQAHYVYRGPAHTFKVINKDLDDLQTWDCAEKKERTWFETFVPVTDQFGFQWVASAGSRLCVDTLEFKIFDVRTALPFEKVDEQFVLSGLKDTDSYVVYGSLLQSTSVTDILINNKTLSPGRGDPNLTFTEYVQPKNGEITVSGPVAACSALLYANGIVGRFIPAARGLVR